MNIDSLETVVNYIFNNNEKLQEEGKGKITIELVGDAGLGKTSLMEQIAQKRGMRFVKINLAQLEEVGDLCGVPIKQYCMYSPEGEEKWVTEKTINQFISMGYTLCPTCEPRMSYAVPEWVPNDPEEKVLLLIDDYTRANSLFMQATMELVNKGEYISWKLPKNTQICLTSNPDNGEYTVSGMDAAQKSRYISFNLDFDINPWSVWAESVGVHTTWINFALFTPEIFTRSKQINPRSYTMFANACSGLGDLEKDSSLEMINLIAKGCFADDGDYIGGLITQFVHNRLDKLVSAEYILTHKDFKEVADKIKSTVFQEGNYRADIASVLTVRMVNYILLKTDKDNVDQVVKRMGEFFDYNGTLLTEDLLLQVTKKLNAKFSSKCTKLLMNPKVMGKLLG